MVEVVKDEGPIETFVGGDMGTISSQTVMFS